MDHGKFVISLDFELMWGVWDKRTVEQYGGNIAGVHTVIPRLLQLFTQYQTRATFSIVGFVFLADKQELLQNIPADLPGYDCAGISPYDNFINSLPDNAGTGKYYFAPELIKLIQQYPEQEIGTHTFCHYYCLERGQTVAAFKADLLQAKNVAANFGVSLTSLVFPRNQFNDDYLQVCKELGIICYRGNESSWIYKARNEEEESLFRRAFKLADTYINLSGHNCYPDEYLRSKFPVDIPASRFLRPYSRKLSPLAGLQLKRIKAGMHHAAKNNLTYHLWWHPHNFGANQDENFGYLNTILKHYQSLHNKYGFKSYTMSELAEKVIKKY